MDEKSARLYAQLNSFRYLVTKTERFIEWSLRQVKNPYVACSFGKDSSVMLHMVLKYAPEIAVIWITFPETKYLNNYYQVADEWKKKFSINLQEIFVDVPAHEPFDDKKAFPHDPFDSYFVGITKQESFRRRVTLQKLGKFYKKNDGMTRICPLADWLVDDVAAYCLSRELPILDSYKTEGFDSRTVTGFTEDIYAFRLNQLSELKQRDLKSYNILIHDYPRLKEYV